MKKYTNEELLEYIKCSATNNNGYPNWKDFKSTTKKQGYPSITTIENRFTSWTNACKLAGFDNGINRFKYSFTDEELINYLKRSAEENNGFPKQSDFTSKNSDYPGLSTIKRRFGSFISACEVAGFTKKLKHVTDGKTYSIEEAIAICFDKFNYKVANNKKGITKEKLLNHLANPEGLLGYAERKAYNQFIRRCFPDRPANAKSINWLLIKNNWMSCATCRLVKGIDNFYQDYSYCKECDHPGKVARTINRRHKQTQAMPKWADEAKIANIYRNCPTGYHVDHIIPLNGKYVCGLHVETNLQYLPSTLNLAKSNYHDSEKWNL